MARIAIFRSFSRFLLTAILCSIIAVDVGAQGQPDVPADSYTFNQPVPVNIRKSNKAIIQMMLLGIDLNGIRVMSPQGKAMEFANNTFISASSLDGSFFYSPTKSSPAEMIQRLNKLQPSRSTNQNPNVPGGGPGIPMPTASGAAGAGPGVHNQVPPGTNPAFTNTFPNTTPTAHAQPQPYTQPNSAFPNSPMPTTTHSQPSPSTYPTATPMPTSPTASHAAMPGMSHNAMPPSSSAPTPMPGMPSPSMSNMNAPSITTQNMYVCGKCKKVNTVTGTLQAGHRCTHCGVVWDKVLDQNGKVVSSTPAAAVGGAFGGVALIIGIVVAIVRKAQSE
ncbi:MAG: hypothetical protein U0941_08955 [Planctomycetaceae bacterium]